MNSLSGKTQLWFSSSRKILKEEGLGFYDVDSLEWTKMIENNWSIINDEIAQFIEHHQNRIEPYFNDSMVEGKDRWSAFAFCFWLWNFRENSQECPETLRILSKVPNLVSASVSIIGPHTRIKEHRGDTNAIYRCHLGLKIPSGLPDCGFAVEGEQREWKEGKLMIFNDAAKHEAWNNTDEIRYVLLFDVIRPEFSHKKFTICSHVLAGISMQRLRKKRPFIAKWPRFIRRIIAVFYRLLIYVILRLHLH